MQHDPILPDLVHIDSTVHDSNNERWNNTRPIYIPSSPSSVSSISVHSLDSTPDLSSISLLADVSDDDTSAPQLLLPSLTNNLPINTPLPPTILSALPIQPTTSTTTQVIHTFPITNMSVPVATTHVPPLHNMPIRGTKLAPKTFRGSYHKVTDFIRHYNRLLDQHQVITEADKCQGILEYCTRKVKDFIRSSNHYQNPNWTLLQSEILKYYDADRDEARYRVTDLTAFIQQSSLHSINDLADWKKYYREYTAIAGFLLQKNLIDNKTYVGYFWYGISPHLQKIFEEKLYINYPQFDTINPWPINYLDEVASFYFKQNKFPQRLGHLPVTDQYDNGRYDSDDSDSDYDSDDEEDDEEDYQRRRRRTKRKKNRSKNKGKKPPQTQVLPDEPKRKIASPPEEDVEGLIRQLNTMSLEDPKYGPLYYKTVKNDPTGVAVRCIR